MEGVREGARKRYANLNITSEKEVILSLTSRFRHGRMRNGRERGSKGGRVREEWWQART